MRLHYIKLLFYICLTFTFVSGGSFAYAQYPGFNAPNSHTSTVSAAGLAPVEKMVDGGSVPIGSTSQVVVLFRNDGVQPVQTGKINLYPSSNVSAVVSLNQCAGDALPSGADCAVAISVKGLQAGSWRIEMLMLHSGRARLATATLSGSIDASGESSNTLSSDIETIPAELDFGSLSSGQSVVEPVIMRNITSNPIKLTDISINSSDRSGYSVDTDCKDLQAGQACIATVTWSPKQKGPATGVLVINHDGPTGLASVSLLGDYSPDNVEGAKIFPEAVPGKGLLVSSQTEVDFGDTVASTSTITVSLVNVGDSAVKLKEIKISGSDSGLSVSGNGCSEGIVLDPVEACPLTLTWSPAHVGEILDDIQILHDGARGVLVLPVRGNAEAAVSQDQKAIILTSSTKDSNSNNIDDSTIDDVPIKRTPAKRLSSLPVVANAASTLDGLKITSFASNRAIVNGPSGSRLIYNNEQIMLGGVVWDINIQKNGIEFTNGDDQVLLLFDRSLSALNRTSNKLSSNTNTSNTNNGSTSSEVTK